MMQNEMGRLLRYRILLWLGVIMGLCLACRLPQPPAGAPKSPLVSPLTGQSPLKSTSPLPTPAADEGPAVWIPFVGGPATESGSPRSTWTLVTLAGAAGLLFVATAAGVFFLIRGLPKRRAARRASVRQRVSTVTDDAAPSEGAPGAEGAPSSGAAPFAEGTMLNEGRYLVLGVQTDVDGTHRYEVKPTVPIDLCPHCYHRVADGAGVACASCGRPLPAHRPEHPVLLARETQDLAVFAVLAELAKRPVEHPAVVVPVETFTETAFGPDRAIVVYPEVANRLSDLPVEPPPLERVLSWGAGLAQGLAAVHDRDVVLAGVSPQMVQVDATDARWLCFDHVAALPDDGDNGVQQRTTTDVRDLSCLIVAAATGTHYAVCDGGAGAARAGMLEKAREIPDPAGRVLSQVIKSTGRLLAADFAVALLRAREDILRSREVRYTICSHTDVGRHRKLNEDSLLALDLSSTGESGPAALSVVAVADGVGGHAAGDVASRLTVTALNQRAESLKADLATGQSLDPQTWIAEAAKAANESVLTERQAMESDMGSTLVMALVDGPQATVLNVGDSRAYWLRPSGIQQVTKDHSLVQRLVDIGQLTPEEARHHPQKSVIYRVMGDTLQLGYDLFDFELDPGHALLLCSDGLSDLVEDRMLWQIWRDTPELEDACEHLVDLANEAGGYDNITVVILQIED